MKKTIALLFSILMLLSLTACASNEAEDTPVITRSNAEDAPSVTPEDAEAASVQPFAFSYQELELIPGARFDADQLPQAASTYEVPSCAIEGTDKVYNYDAFEITAYDDGNGAVIYSIYFIDPNLTTPEGLSLGDSAQTVLELYGEDYVEDGTAWIYTRGNTQLQLILQNDTVAGIEYLMCS